MWVDLPGTSIAAYVFASVPRPDALNKTCFIVDPRENERGVVSKQTFLPYKLNCPTVR